MNELHNQRQRKNNLNIWKQILSGSGNRKKYFYGILAFGTLMGLANVLTALMNMYFIDTYLFRLSLRGFLPAAAMFFVVQFGYSLVAYGFGSCGAFLESHLNCDVRNRCMEKLQTLSCSYFDRTTSGQLLSRVTSDIANTMDILSWSLAGLGYGLMTMVAASFSMFRINPKLSMVLVLAIPLLAILSAVFQKNMIRAHRAFRKANSQAIAAFSEGINGVTATKALAIEEENNQEFAVINRNFRQAVFHSTLISNLYLPAISLMISFSVATVLYVGGVDVLRGALTIGELNFFMTVSSMVFDPIRTFAGIFADFQSSQAAAERVAEILTTVPEIIDKPDVIQKYGDLFAPKRENWEPVQGDIVFDHVNFSYGEHSVLKDFCLTIHEGETIALVGETGSGKSTIVNLLCRFYEPQTGSISIGGRDIRKRSQLWLQSSIGYVLQTPHLFSGTIRENIRYGRLDATNEEVEAAAKQMGVDRFALQFVKGYDTEVGECGNLLSTGQKQLISYARAILAKPAIFVLDEATSSIDTETEAQIQMSTQEILKNRTSIVVAHRLSTIRNADRILVIDGGRIVESGNHKALIAKRGRYYQLYLGNCTQAQETETLNYLHTR